MQNYAAEKLLINFAEMANKQASMKIFRIPAFIGFDVWSMPTGKISYSDMELLLADDPKTKPGLVFVFERAEPSLGALVSNVYEALDQLSQFSGNSAIVTTFRREINNRMTGEFLPGGGYYSRRRYARFCF